MHTVVQSISVSQVLETLPLWLRQQLGVIHREMGGELYLAGGSVRDLLLGKAPVDIDLTVTEGAKIWAGKLAALTGGTFVALGRDEDVARVVSRRTTVDFSSFRQGAKTIVEDLVCRDLTINALAVRLDPLLTQRAVEEESAVTPIDPTDGLADLLRGLIREASPDSFIEDPLRLLRVFRFAAVLGFSIDPATMDQVSRHCLLVQRVAAERIAYELDLVMATAGAHSAFEQMAESGLLWEIIPELIAGVGMEQPRSHHLDVWSHNLETLRQMERIAGMPEHYFPIPEEAVTVYLGAARQHVRLKWAALLHDLGKPATHAVWADKGGRITFYNHDQVGARMFSALARRLHWSNEERERVGHLIAGHMRPFHLANVSRAGSSTLRAAVRMIRKAGGDLPGLFLLAMADSLAGQGSERPEGMEQELVDLYSHLEQVRREHVTPVQSAAPLLTGRDLIEKLHIQPGPIFKHILAKVEEAQMTGEVTTADGALELARKMVTDDSVVTGTKAR